MLRILDCTLRDGGYINDWTFGESYVSQIVDALNNTNVSFVELGYVDRNGSNSFGSTKRQAIEAYSNIKKTKNVNYLVMINYCDFDLDKVPEQKNTDIFGLRMAFKKTDMVPALEYCKALKEKGYAVFVQPMVTVSYSEEEFLTLIKMANELKPYAFYLVDSFGEMNEKDLIKFYSLAEANIANDICLGFHSHNNLQLAYSNCKKFISMGSKHDLIVDSSIFGMGRGAGNLNTEIFLDYLKNEYDMHFNINPIIDVIDKVINNIYVEHHWGYSIPFYISAKNHCHPNYALFLDGKKNLTFFEIEKIIKSISEEKKIKFDKQYINDLYLEFQNRDDGCGNIEQFKTIFGGKRVVLVAPGPSLNSSYDLIKSLHTGKDSIVVTINFVSNDFPFDYAFFSNSRRFSRIEKDKHLNKLIVTSNITNSGASHVVPYFSLLNDKEIIYDNGGLMCIKLMMIAGAESIRLIGFDGYAPSPIEDYANESLRLPFTNSNEFMNDPIKEVINNYRKNIKIEFLTKSHYED